MSFETELLEMLGDSTDAFDIKAMVRRCYFYDFLGSPLRIWDGQGRMFAAGETWLGSIDADGTNHHRAPVVRDARDGASPRYTFTIPFIDEATFEAMKADQAVARGRTVTIYNALFKIGEGLRPQTPLRFKAKLQVMGVDFSEQLQGSIANPVKVRSAAVLCRSLEYGRSRMPAGTYTDTAQRERARQLGVASDSGCVFVAQNSNRTYIVGG